MPTVEGSMVGVKAAKNVELGEVVSKAMEDAIKQCHAEGMFAPQVIKEKMMAAREAAIRAYDEARAAQR
jgi:hypothetical protein